MNFQISLGMPRLLLGMLAIFPATLHGETFSSATISKTVNDVRVSNRSSQAHSAKEGQKFTGSSTLLTGRDSRAELLFPDKTVTRIGANSIFRFRAGTREMEITQGSFLLNVPKNAGGAKIRTATVTAAITSTTTMMEFSPGQWFKFIVLEGVAKLTNRNGDTINVPPGQMIVMRPDARNFPRPVILNLDQLVTTSALGDKGVFGPLSRPATNLIGQSVASQLAQRRSGGLLPTGIVIRGPGGPKGSGPKAPVRQLLPNGGGIFTPPGQGGGGGSETEIPPGTN